MKTASARRAFARGALHITPVAHGPDDGKVPTRCEIQRLSTNRTQRPPGGRNPAACWPSTAWPTGSKGWNYSWIQERIQSYDGQHIPDLKLEERVRLAFTELGTTFIKLGQVLSTRPDLVGPEMARELAHLQTDAPADPPETVRATIEAEFGKPLDTLFAQFEDAPLASASIAQVHRARLHTGEDVVVKVQHAGIADKIMPDLDILAGLAELAEKHSAQVRPYQPSAVVRQFRRTLLRELDFTFERRNLEEFADHFAEDATVHFPRAYPRSSTRRVLTMERLDGILGTDSAALAASGADLNEFARRGATMYLQMIFRDAFYHADPHPGNLMLLPGGVVGVLDCGMVGRLDEELAEAIEDMLMAVVNPSSADLAEILLRLGSAPPGTPRDQLRADVTDFVADYTRQSIQDMDLGGALNSLFEIIRRYNITLPAPLSLLLRTLVELEGTAQQLSPEFSLAEVIRPFYTSMVRSVASRPGASWAGSSTPIAIGNGWWRRCRATWATCSSACATAPSPSTSITAISTRSSTAWCWG